MQGQINTLAQHKASKDLLSIGVVELTNVVNKAGQWVVQFF